MKSYETKLAYESCHDSYMKVMILDFHVPARGPGLGEHVQGCPSCIHACGTSRNGGRAEAPGSDAGDKHPAHAACGTSRKGAEENNK